MWWNPPAHDPYQPQVGVQRTQQVYTPSSLLERPQRQRAGPMDWSAQHHPVIQPVGLGSCTHFLAGRVMLQEIYVDQCEHHANMA